MWEVERKRRENGGAWHVTVLIIGVERHVIQPAGASPLKSTVVIVTLVAWQGRLRSKSGCICWRPCQMALRRKRSQQNSLQTKVEGDLYRWDHQGEDARWTR